MKKLLYLIPIGLYLCSCQYKQTNSAVLTAQATNSPTDTIGTLLTTIDFKVKADSEESKTFTDGFVPWIRLDTPKLQIDKLIDADQIVLSDSTAILLIDYPLNNPATFKLSGRKSGFSRKMLIEMISEMYHQLYAEEEKTATVKTLRMSKRKIANRNQTNGKYGIWGHDLSDLVLDDIKVYKRPDGKIWLVLEIES